MYFIAMDQEMAERYATIEDAKHEIEERAKSWGHSLTRYKVYKLVAEYESNFIITEKENPLPSDSQGEGKTKHYTM